MQNVHIAPLDADQLDRLRALEQELGASVVAYEPVRFAGLSDDQVRRLQALERELGVVLLAYPRAA
ncbi:MAG TPA: hypothetical protein VLW45_01265 [Pelomicrobium sp.]|nr:hypothetical protein [Pelomicrobium sp.]